MVVTCMHSKEIPVVGVTGGWCELHTLASASAQHGHRSCLDQTNFPKRRCVLHAALTVVAAQGGLAADIIADLACVFLPGLPLAV